MKAMGLVLIFLSLIAFVTPAAAYLNDVVVPTSAETGDTVILLVLGDLPDPCWSIDSVTVTLEGLVATVDITLVYDSGGGGCVQILVPYEVYPELVFPAPGLWTIHVVDHGGYLPVGDWLGTITVTGEVPTEGETWESIKAIYR